MTEQQWLDRTLSPTERCTPHAIRQQRAIYQGWIKATSENASPAEKFTPAAEIGKIGK